MNCRILLAASAWAALCAASASAAPEGWTDDFDAAREQAAREGKLVLMDFSGSDWCIWCKRLDSEVFSRKDFIEAATNDFVLVLIDSPGDGSLLSEKAKVQNPKLVEKYGIRGFPTVLITDADGRRLRSTGYMRGGPETYLRRLAEMKASIAVGDALEKSVSGLEKGSADRLAKIEAALSGLGEDMLEDLSDYVRELLANDSDGRFAAKFPKFAYFDPMEKRLRELAVWMSGEFGDRIGKLGLAPGSDPSESQLAAIACEIMPSARKRLDSVRKALAETMKVAPESVKAGLDEISKSLDAMADQLEAMSRAS